MLIHLTMLPGATDNRTQNAHFSIGGDFSIPDVSRTGRDDIAKDSAIHKADQLDQYAELKQVSDQPTF